MNYAHFVDSEHQNIVLAIHYTKEFVIIHRVI